MKKLAALIFVFFTFVAFTQGDGTHPLRFDPVKNKAQQPVFYKKSTTNTFDSTFYHLIDTISIPILEEFSTNRFIQYQEDFTGPNVSDTLWYRLELGGVPVAAGAKFSSFPTYRYTIDTANTTIPDGVDTTELTSVDYEFFDLSQYPVVQSTITLYPDYDIYDTINVPNPEDTIYRDINIVAQDSARLFFVVNQDLQSLWVDHYVQHSYTNAINPFSLGVASFDGTDQFGVPYNDGAASGHGVADYLTSKPIDLNYNVSDEIYFSFLYQGGGLNNAPEPNDSLVLEFYAPEDDEWKWIWSTEGVEMDTFNRVHIPIVESEFLKMGFKFRFKNYATLVAALDYWHIDYVQLRSSPGFGAGDTIINDVAWSMPINTLLEDYTSVPWKHYKAEADKLSRMTDSMPSIIRNSIPSAAFDDGGEIRLDEAPNSLIRTVPADFYGDISNGLNYAPEMTVQVTHDIRNDGYFFPDDVNTDTSKVYKFFAELSTSSVQIHDGNDTTRGEQVFSHFYAYDDGTPEEGYGTIGSQSMLAYKFNAYQSDSLVAIAMRFVRGSEDVEDNPFLLTIWDDNNGKPGSILYQDDFFNAKYPIYTDNHDGFYYYVFEDSQKVEVPQTFYVGWRQIDPEQLDVGFDRNIDNQQNIFYSVNNGGTWNNASFTGSLLIRPVIDSKLNYIVGMEEQVLREYQYDLYPNPTNESFSISGDIDLVDHVVVLDINGRQVLSTNRLTQIDVADLPVGLYIVDVIGYNNESLSRKKLMIK